VWKGLFASIPAPDVIDIIFKQMKIFENLKRRNVIKAAVSYLVLAFALLEAADIITPIIGFSGNAVRYLLIMMVVLFPVWLVFAYIYEWTPTGFKKTAHVRTEESVYKSTSKRLNLWIIGGLLVVVTLLVVVQYIFRPDRVRPRNQHHSCATL